MKIKNFSKIEVPWNSHIKKGGLDDILYIDAIKITDIVLLEDPHSSSTATSIATQYTIQCKDELVIDLWYDGKWKYNITYGKKTIHGNKTILSGELTDAYVTDMGLFIEFMTATVEEWIWQE